MKEFFSKCDQIRRRLGIWWYSLKRSLMENLIFCAKNNSTTTNICNDFRHFTVTLAYRYSKLKKNNFKKLKYESS